MGMRVSALYDHLQLLGRAGLVTRKSAPESGRVEARYTAAGQRLVVDYDLRSKEGRRASRRIARALLRAAERDFARGTQLENAKARPPNRNLWVSRAKGWLDAKQLRQVSAHLQAIDDRSSDRAMALERRCVR